MSLKCFIGLHDWLYCSDGPIKGEWLRACRRCGKRMYATYDMTYGDTTWHKGW